MEPRGKRAELLRWIERVRPALIGEAEWDELRRELSPVSPGYLRRLLRDSGLPLAPLIDGVRQETFESLEASLLKLLEEYQQGDPARRTSVRRAVIEAKDHARWAARKPAKRAEKEEMTLWMLTWLENPPLFPLWVQLRRPLLGAETGVHGD
ncbi:MAG: hypothetical protein ACRD5L_02800 [Bryobacteraceae bacterium]